MTTQMGVIDVNNGGFESDDEAALALMESWKDAEDEEDTDQLSEQEDEDPEDSDETTEDDGEEQDDQSEESDDDEDEEEDTKPTVAGDDALVEVKVDGEVKSVTVAELKRLYGQEASLTRKSQELAERRKAAEDLARAYEQATVAVLDVVKKRYEEYAGLNWLVLSKQLDAEDLQTLSEQAQQARQEYEDVSNRLREFKEKQEKEQHEAMAVAARAAVQALRDPESPYHVPEWGDKVYADIRAYAVKNGLPQEEVDSIVSPAVIKLLWKAQQFDKASATVKTQKKTIKKVLKSKQAVPEGKGKQKAEQAMQRLAKTHSDEDAVEALISRWAD